MIRSRRFALVAAFATATLLLAACGSSKNSATSASSTSSITSTTTASSSSTTVGSTTAISIPPTTTTSYLTNVTAQPTASGESIAFQFQNSIPGYAVSYIDPPLRSDAEGSPITIAGAALVKVTLSLASGADLSNGYKKTYNGPDRIVPSGAPSSTTNNSTTNSPGASESVVQEVVKAGDFESVMTWGIGTKTKVPFTVKTLQSPPSIIIEFTQ